MVKYKQTLFKHNQNKHLILNIRGENNDMVLDVNIKNCIINQVNEITFVGIIIDNKLDWKSHINMVCTKLSISITILNKINHKLNLIL